MGSLTSRQLRATFILPQGNFPGTNSNTLILQNLRMSARITGAGNFTNACTLHVWGMKQADMNAITVLFGLGGNVLPINIKALLRLEAQEGSAFFKVFEGQLFEGQPDYRNQPDVELVVNGFTSLGPQYFPAPPTSVDGGADVAGLAQQLAKKMGFTFENNGVTGSIDSPYMGGTLMEQFKQLAEEANFDFYFDAKSTLIICQKNQPRLNKQAVVLSPTSGLVGYVTLARFGIELDCLWNSAIENGSPILLQNSQVPGTDGLWFPNKFTHDLESEKPGGRWFSHLECMRFPASAEGVQ